MAAASSATSSSPPQIKVKKELCSDNDTIKELAETAMNDILGWYGYDSVDRLELPAANSLASSSRAHDEEPPPTTTTRLHANSEAPITTITSPGSPSSKPSATAKAKSHQQQQQQLQLQAQVAHGESSTSEKDSSRESSKSPMMMKILDKPEQICQWCRKVIPAHQTGILGTTEGMIFCTEACFSQSRRASFKRAKTCDWCRHVRHAVSYVDFQDGASQLQFCSDKCLNQYKMQIFCNETQAHLEMNPHLKEKGSSAGSLITPELWMKNCKSCSMSPVSDRSAESLSPAPSELASLLRSSSPEPPSPTRAPLPKKPLISVAPPSKLLSKTLATALASRSSPKGSRKRRPSHRPQAMSSSITTTNAKRASLQSDPGAAAATRESVVVGSFNNNNNNVPNNNLRSSSGSPSGMKPCAALPSSVVVMSPNVQDLRMLQKKHPVFGGDGREPPLGASVLAPPPPPPQFLAPPGLNLIRPPGFFPLNPALRFNGGPLAGLVPPMPPPPSPLPGGGGPPPGHRPPPPVPALLGFPGAAAAAPPVTILVPYPIIVPVPLPIPIPIPVIDFLKAALPSDDTKASQSEETRDPQKEPDTVQDDGPLDFTVSGVGKGQDERRTLHDASAEPEPATIETESPSDPVFPRFKRLEVVRQDSEGSSAERTVMVVGPEPADNDDVEEDMERERKELVERSRPLRKRKRLVVQQHLQIEPPRSQPQPSDPLLLSDGGAEQAPAEEQ
ncbi:sine oculis-binding protein homolog A [Anopheles bellator]|uniref:sine oculis-binding protein homolog A n=1 Tax=Anopheles bellator TaxID=139047 RepID=UPI00264A2633|nr:sine oculis-binding protein homolog A [Anopheles bellator]